MAIYRDAYNGVSVRLDSRTVTVSAAPSVSVHVLAATARAENDNQPIRFDAEWSDADGYRHRRYFRTQQL